MNRRNSRPNGSVVQFNLTSKLAFFPLDESGSPAVVNNTLSTSVSVIKAARTRCVMKKAAVPSILIAAMLGCCCDHS